MIGEFTIILIFFPFFSWYYRYPWASYCEWLAPGQPKIAMAGLLFFCCRRVLPWRDLRESVPSTYVDVCSLPYVPPYEMISLAGEKLFVSMDSKYVYDVRVTCTYSSKRWKMEAVARDRALVVFSPNRVVDYERDGHLIVPDGASFVPIAKGALLCYRKYYSKFEKQIDPTSSTGDVVYFYDPESRVNIKYHNGRNSAQIETVAPRSSSRAYRNVSKCGMKALPFISWATVVKGKFGEFLCVLTDYPKFSKRIGRQFDPTFEGNVDYYDVTNDQGDAVVKFWSSSSRTALVRRDNSDREVLGITFVEWLNQKFYGIVRSNQKSFVFNHSKFVRLSVVGNADGLVTRDRPAQVVIKQFDLG